MADDDPSSTGGPSGRRLERSNSAYLRTARDQPIDWHPWGPEPFDLARRTGRPILLDIGAVWCHWCHVMDEGTYSDGEVARLLRQHFVAVKVDRDEHPEVDRRFQRQVSALTGQGGWPLTAFLTAEGDVFLGGTYFPADDGMGRPGFRRVLKEVARLYREEPDRIRENASQVQAALGRLAAGKDGTLPPDAFVTSVRAELEQSFDAVNGGFGFAPKFPHPTAVSFLLWAAHESSDPLAERHALETLARMADGGMYDHVGGGFHRYSVDEGWHIPHFEKMGMDNAALLHAYAEGARRSPDPRLRDTVRGIVDWTLTVLATPDGGFGSSQDADNAPGDDGNYFTWSRAELKATLEPDELKLVTRVFGVGSDGRMPHDPDRNVLFRLMSPSEAAEGLELGVVPADALARSIAKLRAAREARPRPFVDPAVYADINGAFLRGIATASPFLPDGRALATARHAADRILDRAFEPDRGVAHRLDPSGPSGFGHLEDQALFALGLTELAGVTLERRYLAAARQLLGLIDREFVAENGLLRDLAPKLYDGPTVGGLDRPSYPLEDSPHLAANAAAAIARLRFGALTQERSWAESARPHLGAVARRLEGAGLFGAGSALAVGLLRTEPVRVVVTGHDALARDLLTAARTTYYPNLWVFEGTPPAPFTLPEEAEGWLGGEGASRALLCLSDRCRPPIGDATELAAAIRSVRATAG